MLTMPHYLSLATHQRLISRMPRIIEEHGRRSGKILYRYSENQLQARRLQAKKNLFKFGIMLSTYRLVLL